MSSKDDTVALRRLLSLRVYLVIDGETLKVEVTHKANCLWRWNDCQPESKEVVTLMLREFRHFDRVNFYLLVAFCVFSRYLERLRVDRAELILNISLGVIRRILSCLDYDQGARQREKRPARIQQVEILVASNNWMAFQDGPGRKILRFNAMPDISAEQRIFNRTFLPYLSFLCDAVTP